MKSDCKQLERFLSRYVDNELSPADKAWVEAHLSQCHAHDEELAQLRRMSERLAEDLGALKESGALERLAREIKQPPARTRWDWRTLPLSARPAYLAALVLAVCLGGIALMTQVGGPRLESADSAALSRAPSDHRWGFDTGRQSNTSSEQVRAFATVDFGRHVQTMPPQDQVVYNFANPHVRVAENSDEGVRGHSARSGIAVEDAKPSYGYDGAFVVFYDGGFPAPVPAAAPASATPLTVGRKIIRNAGIALEVKDVTSARADVEALVIRLGGMIARVSLEGNSTLPSVQMTIWIPAEHLDEVRVALRRMGKILKEDVGIKDITADYFDTDTRLHNLRVQEERMLTLYNRENAKLEEILKLEDELTRIRTAIEKLEGQTRLWDHQVRFSSVDLYLTQTPPPPPPRPPIAKEKPQTFMDPLVRGVQSAKGVLLYSLTIITSMIAWFFVGIVWLLPWIAIALVAWVVYRMTRRSRPRP